MTAQPELAVTLVKQLIDAQKTLSTAESCTGGLIAKMVTDVAGCSSVFFGGCVTYTNEIKTNLLGVDPHIFEADTEVSAACSKAMAEGIRHRLGTDFGVSTTGYAGPTGGTEKNPVGTVYISVATPTETICRRIQAPNGSTRKQIRNLAATAALQMVSEALQSNN